ncbi:acyl carrier protein [Vibrio cholerae]|uniref:acyl carrier protein n=1 Tax=Vibrio cholerae TaxID=666 RepID=UPI0011D99444|nr:acyl carrier protein [Vibrio cholerae]EJB8349298.1 acyl carrier protein [Vibrio cholerae]EJB8378430.1 acyl carrier protein [Vibrio cholerae]TXY55463.1 acyl carrier protein [Vibrio cholerae]BCN18980.1 putative D-alanine--poly(phosphoribitol) ligase subunit [Vibrio cholerae]BCN21920.1 putative D-alanine--poly(phosphoribitol) ligase subunit [Vibrio cholerae]
MENKIIEIIARVSKRPTEEIRSHMSDKDLWDSFAHLELTLSIEEEFDIMLEPDEIAEMRTPREVIKTITKKI